MIILIHL